MPFLSIIIIAKNEEKVLPGLLASIRRQTYKDYEIIVADAASTDRTREIAESFGARVVPGGLPGPGRNRGAQVSQGEVLLFLDADGELPSEKFLEENLAEMKDRGVLVATTYIKPLSDKTIDAALLEVCNAYNTIMERIKPHAPGCCIFVKKSVHDEIHGFDESLAMAEDHDYVQRAEKAGYRFRILLSQPIGVSVRRLEKDGRWGIAIKYLKSELLQMIEGPHKDMPFAYAMGGSAVGDEKLEQPLSRLVEYLSKLMDTEIDLAKLPQLTKEQLAKLKDILID